MGNSKKSWSTLKPGISDASNPTDAPPVALSPSSVSEESPLNQTSTAKESKKRWVSWRFIVILVALAGGAYAALSSTYPSSGQSPDWPKQAFVNRTNGCFYENQEDQIRTDFAKILPGAAPYECLTNLELALYNKGRTSPELRAKLGVAQLDYLFKLKKYREENVKAENETAFARAHPISVWTYLTSKKREILKTAASI